MNPYGLDFYRRYLERAAENKADKLDKHRFLVQTKAIEDEDYEKIVSATAEQRIDAVSRAVNNSNFVTIPIRHCGEVLDILNLILICCSHVWQYMRLWEGASKDERKNFKLKVEYNYSELGSAKKIKKGTENAGDEKEHVTKENDIKSKVRKLEKKRVEEEEEDIPESATSDFINLKTKYSTLVEYTVCLVAERDTIARRLEESDRDLARENARKKENSNGGSGSGDTNKTKKVEKITLKGNAPKVRK